MLAYDAAQVTANAAGGTISPATALNVVLPSANVTGAAFYQNRLLLSLNLGTAVKVVSYDMGADFVSPTGSAMTEVTVARSSSNNEPEGLAVTPTVLGSYPLAGALHWQMLPSIPLYSRILNYMPWRVRSSSQRLRHSWKPRPRCNVQPPGPATRGLGGREVNGGHPEGKRRARPPSVLLGLRMRVSRCVAGSFAGGPLSGRRADRRGRAESIWWRCGIR